MSGSILILGGTAEAIKCAKKLIAKKADEKIIYSLAGRTTNQPNLGCDIRIGGFGGVNGLVSFVTENHVVKIIDATHPYALEISKNAKQAAYETGIKYVPMLRPEWKKQDVDDWIEVSSIAQAINAVPKTSRVFLALGKQHIDGFSKRTDCHFVVRMVEPPEAELNFSSYQVVTGIPNSSIQGEIELLKEHKIEILVSRNSGGNQSYAKIKAAQSLKIPVIMINRPSTPPPVEN